MNDKDILKINFIRKYIMIIVDILPIIIDYSVCIILNENGSKKMIDLNDNNFYDISNEIHKMYPEYDSFEEIKGKTLINNNNATIIYNLTEMDKIDELFVIPHELRHLYQFQEVKFDDDGKKILEDKRIIDLWRRELNGKYRDSKQLNDNVELFNSQMLELDANAFTQVIMKKLLGINIKIHSYDRNEIFNDVVNLIDQSYPDSYIYESIAYNSFNPVNYFSKIGYIKNTKK
jgi:hypothetical protein